MGWRGEVRKLYDYGSFIRRELEQCSEDVYFKVGNILCDFIFFQILLNSDVDL